MGEADCEGNWVSFWWARPCSVHLSSNFLLIVGCVPCCLTWDQTTVVVMKIKVTSLQKVHAHTAALSAPDPAMGHRWPRLRQRLLDTHGQAWVSLLWVLVGPGPFSWVLVCRSFVCALPESFPPVLWKLCNLIPLASNVKFPGGSQSIC